ncbi:MAG: hypothetical protein K0R82_2851 [Flavipsychrobacter sp.]|jgi:PBP1b-binding outer membrane lipoprotein LpoB|nr:hypothetical protein [Flavipsychrobacter sp.]
MKKLQIVFAALLISVFAASCGEDTDGDDTAMDSVEVGPANEADSYKDTAVLVPDSNNTLDANPVNDTTVKPEAVTR